MRKQRFRVWDKQTYSYEFNREFVLILSGDLMELYTNNDGSWDYHFADAIRFIIEFGTGLKDKNGKEIYEGDIITDKDSCDEICIAKVIFDETNAQFVCEAIGKSNCWPFEDARGDVFEVIGNIHENPELCGDKS